MKKLLQRWFARPNDDAFITLIQVAMETPAIRDQLILLLSQPHRTDKIRQWARELHEEGAPETLITALRYLEDEARANTALTILTGNRQTSYTGHPDSSQV